MPLRYLLDTNICIYIAKHKPESVLHRFEKLSVGEVGMSLITYGELMHGACKSTHSKKIQSIIEKLAGMIPPLPIPIEAGKFYGDIRSKLERQGKIIGNNDLWIASHAMALELTLVSNNLKEFSRIKKLKLDNWVE